MNHFVKLLTTMSKSQIPPTINQIRDRFRISIQIFVNSIVNPMHVISRTTKIFMVDSATVGRLFVCAKKLMVMSKIRRMIWKIKRIMLRFVMCIFSPLPRFCGKMKPFRPNKRKQVHIVRANRKKLSWLFILKSKFNLFTKFLM